MRFHNVRLSESIASGDGAAVTAYVDVPGKVSGFTSLTGQLISAAPTGTVTTPTLDVTVQSSFDGTNWFDVMAFTQATTAAVNEAKFDSKAKTLTMGSMLRVKFLAETASGVATYGLDLWLLLNVG
ncbi:MAG: hypothetical protein ABFD89_23835 [Bryobacteraceae bacterium]